MKADPKVLEGISDRDKILAGKKSLNEFTAEELDALYEEVMNLRELGRADKKRIDREQAALRDRVINGLEDALPYDYPAEIPAAEPGKKPQKVSFSEMRLDSYRPPRLADMLDGGEGFRGAHHDFFINRVNAAEDAKIRSMQKRRKWMIERLNKLGYEVDDRNISRVMSEVLAQEFGEANGTMYTLDEVLEIYAGFKNAKKRAAIIMGNGRDRILAEVRHAARDPEIDPDTAMVDAITQVENEYQALIDKLTDEQKQLADLVIEEYSENYDRIEQTNGYFYNAVLGFEENYTPIITRGRSTEVHEKQLAQELLVRSAYRRAGIDRGFSKERLKKIKIEHRRPINLGLFQHWEQTVAKQEHFIAYSEWSKLSNAILESDAGMNWRERIIQGSKQGEALLQQMKDYRSRVVQPNSFMSNDSTNRLLKYLRNNAAIAYLSFNMVTAMKQIPSLGFYLVEATPGDLLAAISTAARDWNGLRERALERNPQLISRSLDRDFAYLDKLASDPKALKAKRDLARFGTAMIRTFDAIAVTIGEEAVYNKALRDGMSQAEAAQLAQNVTLRTQPAGASKDSSKLFTKESLYLFTQFSNQLNQIWNMFTYDVPKAYGGSTYRRQKIATIASLAMSSYLIWALTNRQALPDEEEPLDFVNLVAGQFISAAPIVGPMIYSAMQGFTPETAVTSPFASIGSIAGISLQNIGEDLSDYERWKIADSLFESAAIALGIPYIAPNRAIKAATGAIEGDLNFFETLSTAVTGDTWTVAGED